MTTRVWTATIAALLPAVTAAGLAWAAAPDTDPLPSYVRSISAQLDPRVPQTLAQLDGTGRQLLALRSYLRSASHLAERGSWTEEQIEAFESSPSTATIATDWAAAGWAAKLDAAVRAASDSFVGPQASPPAPWHYTYVPEGVVSD